ncbi:helix-turn-helix domain-containing protein [Amycolatopsis rhizosphaerae]|uniref:helix-turn-helix domain-containing protein n=1 Tax=Amycolatopsis rhizosphaerae TaxID=2053003 RepID=UPI001FE675C6|nr:helix-turn-helix transcriptional regulator [Amycolatopsis rhizosphaerae]
MPSVHDARAALGARLRELRVNAQLTGRQLAALLHWPHSKVSKLENGRQTPSSEDIRAWTGATNAVSNAEALLVSLQTLETQYAEWQRQLRTGLKPHQAKLTELNARTRFFRVFEPTFVPGLLQTAEYARARFEQSGRVFGVRHDIDEAVQTRIQRQEILYRPEKRFHFVLTEAVLRYRLCPPEVMLGQLDRLVSLSMLRNVKLGIIGFDVEYDVAPAHGFWLLDEDRAMIETFSAELNLAQPQETELYGRIFARLATVEGISYGRDARNLIANAAEHWAAYQPDESA